MTQPIQIGLLLFPNVTQLDLTGPAEVFGQIPGSAVHLLWKTATPIATTKGWQIVPTTTFAECPQLDVICVPGGPGQNDIMQDDEVLDFLRRQAKAARYITSVCTGSLVLGAAGLLQGYRAACHAAVTSAISALAASRIAEGVREKRGAGAGWVTP